MSIRIRAATTTDAALIADLNCRLALESEGLELDPARVLDGVTAALTNPAYGRYYLAEIEAQVAGQLLVTQEWSDWRNSMFWWIQSVYVLPQFRRRGVFTQLHAHLAALARAEPAVCGLRLYVEHANELGKRTYRACAFESTGYEVMEYRLEAESSESGESGESTDN
jgi:ribosomal protein S18 acetylase RimI-like enzyme